MKTLKPNQQGFIQPVDNQQAGFITLIVCLLAILIAVIILVYLRVAKK